MNGEFRVPQPINEPIRSYGPGSAEKKSLKAKLAGMRGRQIEIPLVIGGEEVRTGKLGTCVVPHDHGHVLATYHKAGKAEVERAIAAARAAHATWSRVPFAERAAILLRAAEMLAGPFRDEVNAATMLGQSKTAFQAEIDSACELIDFWRFNPYFAQRIYEEQPASSAGVWNRVEYRPLEGFVFAVTPFNFTSIAGNLPTSPALMGNTVLWKPASSAVYSAYHVMKVLIAAGMPAGVAQHGGRVGRGGGQPGPRLARVRGDPLHRLHRGVPADVEDDRQHHRELPLVPEDRRRDRRQGLRLRARLRRRRLARDRPGARRVRVPGAEVLGGVAGVRPGVAVAEGQGRPPGPTRRGQGRRPRGLHQLHGRRDRQARLRQHQGLHRLRQGLAGGRDHRRRRLRRPHRLLHPAHRGADRQPEVQAHAGRDLRARADGVRLPRRRARARRSSCATPARRTGSRARCSQRTGTRSWR